MALTMGSNLFELLFELSFRRFMNFYVPRLCFDVLISLLNPGFQTSLGPV